MSNFLLEDLEFWKDLVELLGEVLLLQTRDGRDAWLSQCLPSSIVLCLNRSNNYRYDLTLIVNQVQNIQSDEGSWYIVKLVEKAIEFCQGTIIALLLKEKFEKKLLKLKRAGIYGENPSSIIYQISAQMLNKLQESNSDLAKIIRVFALPHYFDRDQLINYLKNKKDEISSVDLILEKLCRFSFIKIISPGIYVYHEEIRDSIIKIWRLPENKDEYIANSKIFMDYFIGTKNFNEANYHEFIVNPPGAYLNFRNRIKKLVKNYQLGEMEILLRFVQEQKWILPEEEIVWIIFYQATLKRFLSKWDEAIEIYRNLLSKNSLSSYLKSAALNGLGSCLIYRGKWLEARDVLTSAFDLSMENQNEEMKLIVLLSLGWCYFRLGDTEKAIEIYEDVLLKARSENDVDKTASALGNIGRIYRQTQNFEKALSYYEEAAFILKKFSSSNYMIARALRNLAITLIEKGEWEKAFPFIEEAFSIQKRIDDSMGMAYSLGTYGNYFEKIDQLEKAMEYYIKSLEIFELIGARKEIMDVSNSIAKVYQIQGKAELAAHYSDKAVNIQNELYFRREE
jgi:tetratricopeptide (TPR) repeat protein